MTRWVVLTAGPEDADELAAVVDKVASVPGVDHCSAGREIPGSVGGLGVVWDLTTDLDLEALQLPSDADAVPLATIAEHRSPQAGPRVKRTLLLTIAPGTPADVIERFERDTVAMPDHIGSIRSWALSRVDTSVPGASTRWTHVWEQEFADVAGLVGEYLLHPYHWTHVDRWFDGEMPGHIVEPAIAHLYREASGPVLIGADKAQRGAAPTRPMIAANSA